MPGPLDLCARFLEAEGAAVERSNGLVEAVVPGEVAQALGLRQEFVRLVEMPGEARDAVPAGYGSALLDRVLTLAADGVFVARADVTGSAADKAVGARALERFNFLNAAVAAGTETASDGVDIAWWFRYAIEADERVEGLLAVGTSARGAPLPAIIAALEDPRRLRDTSGSGDLRDVTRGLTEFHAQALCEAARGLAGPLAHFVHAVGRRHARDRRRIETYYRDFLLEMRRDLARRTFTAEGAARREAKIEATARDRLAKVADLEDKYAVRISLALAGVLGLRVGRRTCVLTVRRRAQQFHFPVYYDGLAQDFDPETCRCCGASTYAVGFCDEALHVLCRACLGRTGGAGRRGCPACAGERPEPPGAWLQREADAIARREGFLVEEASEGPPPDPCLACSRPGDKSPVEGRSEGPPPPRPPEVPPVQAPAAPEPLPRPVQGSLFPDLAASGQDLPARVLALVRAAPGLRAAEIASRLGLPAVRVRPVLHDLVNRGRVLRTGMARGTRYFPVPSDR